MTTFEAKLGNDRTRIWLEGSRLKEAGFKKGDAVQRVWSKGKLVLIRAKAKDVEKLERHERGTVSGSPERPIIDISAQRVAETFKGERVSVAYTSGQIVIKDA